MTACPYCKTEVDEQLNFCIICERQVRCLSCGKPLFADKTRCLICGTLVVVSITPVSMINEYLLEEEIREGSSTRKVHLKMSDTAIGVVGERLDRYFQPWYQSDSIPGPRLLAPPLPAPESEPIPARPDDVLVSTSRSSAPDVPEDKYAWAKDYIVRVGDQFDIKIVDFKGKTKGEQQRRFVLLFVWGYQQHFGVPVPDRKPILSMAKRLNVWDTSFSNSMTKMERDLLIKSDDGLRLAPSATKEVHQILDDLQDGELKGYATAAKSGKKPTEKNRKPSDALIQEWLGKEIDLCGFDVRTLQKAKMRQKVEFGLWVLKEKLGVEKAPLSAVISFVVQKYPTIGGSIQSLQNSATDKDYIERTSQGECVLTHKGEEDIETLLPENLKANKAGRSQ